MNLIQSIPTPKKLLMLVAATLLMVLAFNLLSSQKGSAATTDTVMGSEAPVAGSGQIRSSGTLIQPFFAVGTGGFNGHYMYAKIYVPINGAGENQAASIRLEQGRGSCARDLGAPDVTYVIEDLNAQELYRTPPFKNTYITANNAGTCGDVVIPIPAGSAYGSQLRGHKNYAVFYFVAHIENNPNTTNEKEFRIINSNGLVGISRKVLDYGFDVNDGTPQAYFGIYRYDAPSDWDFGFQIAPRCGEQPSSAQVHVGIWDADNYTYNQPDLRYDVFRSVKGVTAWSATGVNVDRDHMGNNHAYSNPIDALDFSAIDTNKYKLNFYGIAPINTLQILSPYDQIDASNFINTADCNLVIDDGSCSVNYTPGNSVVGPGGFRYITVSTGQVGNFSVRVTADGSNTTTWTPANYKVGIAPPPNGLTAKFDLPSNVPPGESRNVPVTVQPGSFPAAGTYTTNYRYYRVEKNGAPFGSANTCPLNIYVSPGPLINGATCTDMTINGVHTNSATVVASQDVAVTVTVQNTGSTTWTNPNFKLGEYTLAPPATNSVRDSGTFLVGTRSLLPTGGIVGPGESYTFPVTIPGKAPGGYDFAYQMVEEGVAWFGPILCPAHITAAPHAEINFNLNCKDMQGDARMIGGYAPPGGSIFVEIEVFNSVGGVPVGGHIASVGIEMSDGTGQEFPAHDPFYYADYFHIRPENEYVFRLTPRNQLGSSRDYPLNRCASATCYQALGSFEPGEVKSINNTLGVHVENNTNFGYPNYTLNGSGAGGVVLSAVPRGGVTVPSGASNLTFTANTIQVNSVGDIPITLTTLIPGGSASGYSVSCHFTAAPKPIFKVNQGDVKAGAWFGATCSADPGYQMGSGRGGIRSFATGSGIQPGIAGAKGSSGEMAAFALGPIYGNIASGYGFFDGLLNNAGVVNSLSFANTTFNSATSTWGGLFFGTAGALTNTYCINSRLDTGYTPTAPGAVNYGTSGNFTVTGNLIVPSFTVANGQKLNIYVTGNVYLSGNITYSTAGWNITTGGNSVPSLSIAAAGNIYVEAPVTQLDGLFAALPTTASNGVIYSCYNGPCNQQLVINGAVIAKRLALGRDLGVNDSLNKPNPRPAEIINYVPEMVISDPLSIDTSITGGTKPTIKYNSNSLFGLPPVF